MATPTQTGATTSTTVYTTQLATDIVDTTQLATVVVDTTQLATRWEASDEWTRRRWQQWNTSDWQERSLTGDDAEWTESKRRKWHTSEWAATNRSTSSRAYVPEAEFMADWPWTEVKPPGVAFKSK